MPRGAEHAAFCCRGCEAVAALIRAEGLDRFYLLGGGRGQPVGAVPRPAARDWLAPLEAAGRLADGKVLLELDVQGIHCAACVWLLQELWRRRAGAVGIEVNPALGRAQLCYEPVLLDLGDYLDEIERLGYRTGPVGKVPDARAGGLLIRLGICTSLALNAMMFALAGYLGMSEADGALFQLFRWLALGLATAAVLVGGPVFFRSAFAGLRRRVLHLDLPISLGILLAYGASVYGFATGGGDSYFDTVTVFVALMVLGRYLQQRAVQRNRNYLLANDGAEHIAAKRLSGEGIERVPIRAIEPGDRLLLAPGDLVPVAARPLDRPGVFSLDWIDGESAPRVFARGQRVPAGAFQQDRRPVVVEALESAEQSGLPRLLATPERRGDEVRGRERFWVLLNRTYVALVLALAALAALVWAFVDPARVASVVTSVLVVTCPCALGLATPLAFDLALAALRRRGIFVRRASLLDRARHVRKIVFDKTGTLTWGGLRASVLRPVPAELRDVLFTMASSSNHPASRAVAECVAADGARFLPEAEVAVEEKIGLGVEALWHGATLRLGSERFALGERGDGNGGADTCVFARDGRVAAVFGCEEDYRAGIADEIEALARDGCDLYLLSGDRTHKVARAARRLGFSAERAWGDVSAGDKAAFVRQLDDRDTMMVGDGLNDAPAFEAAFCAGTPALDRPVMPARADFFYAGGGVGAVSSVLRVAHRFHRVVAQNLWLAGIYNAVAVTLCLCGVMTPLLCAVLMPASSLVLIGHTMAALRGAEVRP